MNARTWALAAALWAAWPAVPTPGAGAAAVVRDERGFRLAVPPWRARFPRDHGAHPGFASEWWYWTGHLAGAGRMFGFELTFFRVAHSPAAPASASAWRAADLYVAHLALTDERARRFHHHERASRPALGMAGADSTRLHVWIGDWTAEAVDADDRARLRAGAGEVALDLELTPRKPPVVHGRDGVSQKTAGVGNASHYVSFTRMATTGRVVVGGDTLAVTGDAWMDHEFGSGRPQGALAGWDWFAVQLDDGRELMLYDLRRRDGAPRAHSSGTLVDADGRGRTLPRGAFGIEPLGRWRSPETGAVYPSGWRLRVPGEGLELTVTPVLRAQELVSRAMGGITYWEGRCRVRGRSRDAAVSGQAYAELTGYAGPAPF